MSDYTTFHWQFRKGSLLKVQVLAERELKILDLTAEELHLPYWNNKINS